MARLRSALHGGLTTVKRGWHLVPVPKSDLRTRVAVLTLTDVLTTMQLRRLRTGLSQEEFAAKIGVSRRTISVVERRLSEPSVRLALTIARALDTTVEEIFTEGPAPPDERPEWDLDPYELAQKALDAGGVGIPRGA